MTDLLPFGTPWPVNGELRERASQEREALPSHRAAEAFDDDRPSVVLRIRRPGVVLTVEAAGHPWLKDSWVHNRDGGLS